MKKKKKKINWKKSFRNWDGGEGEELDWGWGWGLGLGLN